MALLERKGFGDTTRRVFRLSWKRAGVQKHVTVSLQKKGSLGNDQQGSPTEGAVAHCPVRDLSSFDTDRITEQQCSQRADKEASKKAGSETLMSLVAVRKEVET